MRARKGCCQRRPMHGGDPRIGEFVAQGNGQDAAAGGCAGARMFAARSAVALAARGGLAGVLVAVFDHRRGGFVFHPVPSVAHGTTGHRVRGCDNEQQPRQDRKNAKAG